MFNNDFLMRQIEGMCKALGNTIFKKNESIFEIVNEKGDFSQAGFLYHQLKKMILDGKINDAEDILFEKIEEDPSEDNLTIALEFYKDLQNLSEDILHQHGFSKQEISDGLYDVYKLYQQK